MKQLKSNAGLRIAVIASLFCHILMFNNIELTFGKNASGKNSKFSEIFFLGSILRDVNYYPQSPAEIKDAADRLNTRIFSEMLTPLEKDIPTKVGLPVEKEPLMGIRAKPSSNKPLLANLVDKKSTYFRTIAPLKIKKTDSSIMFYPPMPYHFLLYFKNRQTAHMEVAFYISPKGKVLGLKRKISSGNPEVDLLVMRNLIHFLNLCKSNLALGSWQTVRIDLSP
jgi:hypothetical protein